MLTVHELHIKEVMSELLIKQVRGNFPFNFLESFFPKDVNTRRKEVCLLPAIYARTMFRQRSLKVSILKTYNWIKSVNLLPQELKNLSARVLSKHLHMISHNYIFKNIDLFELFY